MLQRKHYLAIDNRKYACDVIRVTREKSMISTAVKQRAIRATKNHEDESQVVFVQLVGSNDNGTVVLGTSV